MKNSILILLLLLIVSCHSRERAEIELMKQEAAAMLAESQAKLKAIQAAEAQASSGLVHLVMLNIKDDLKTEQKKALMTELEKLGSLEGVMNYQIGQFEELGDARALSDYELILSMAFQSEEVYRNYQQDETHLAVREALKAYLAGPPATYDYLP
ncbi:MAG: Dabb family protein [Bacteroidota bacterium]